MTDDTQETQEDTDDIEYLIYVLPTEPGKPPRAMLGTPYQLDETMIVFLGAQVMWSQDLGLWIDSDGDHVHPELATVISERCRELEVPGF